MTRAQWATAVSRFERRRTVSTVAIVAIVEAAFLAAGAVVVLIGGLIL